MSSAVDYTLGHRESPPAVGLLRMAEDFGTGEEPPVDVDLNQVRIELKMVRNLLDDARYVERNDNPDFAWTEIGEASRILEIVEGRLGKASAPEPTTPPAPLPMRGFTARTHWDGSPYAVDVYAGPKGTPIRLALGGVAEGWGSITPLSSRVQYDLLKAGGGWQPLLVGTPAICMTTLGETMFTWVLRATNGNSYAISHVLQEAKFGTVEPWEAVAYLGDSGIAGLCGSGCSDCNPAHLHVFAWRGHGPVPSNGLGTIPALQACADLGIEITELVPAIPSPSHYQQCKAKGGRFV